MIMMMTTMKKKKGVMQVKVPEEWADQGNVLCPEETLASLLLLLRLNHVMPTSKKATANKEKKHNKHIATTPKKRVKK